MANPYNHNPFSTDDSERELRSEYAANKALGKTIGRKSKMSEFKLKNGAEIIAKHGDVVLASWDGHTFPYVTWKVDSDGNAYWGRYFADYNLAVANFVRRARG